MADVAAPRIQSLRVRAVRVPMAEPHRTAGGVIAESPLVLTDLITDAGSVGRSMVFTYTATALKPTAELIVNIGRLVEGQPLAPAEVERQLWARMRLLGTQGLVGIALAAIDMAAWDALARLHGLPLHRLLGGVARPVPAYAGIGFDGADGCARAAERFARQGFGGIKAKIGYPTVDEDVAVVRAMRAAAGASMRIMVDYNQCLTPGEAVERLRRLDDEGLDWVEEPTLATDPAGLAQVAREARTPLQCGENWWGLADMRQSIAAGASDLVMPDVMKIGGVSGWLRAAALAQAHGLRLSNHLFPEISARLLCVTPTAHWLEYADWWNPVLAQPLRLERGVAMVDESPGSGIDWDEDAVGRHAA